LLYRPFLFVCLFFRSNAKFSVCLVSGQEIFNGVLPTILLITVQCRRCVKVLRVLMFQNLHFLVSWRLDSNSAMKTRVEVFAYCEHTCPRSSSSANNSYRCTDHAKHQQRANGEASETHCKPRGCGTFGLGLSQQVPCLFYCLQREFSFKRRRLTTQKKNTWRLLILLLQMISSAALPKLCSGKSLICIMTLPVASAFTSCKMITVNCHTFNGTTTNR